MPHLFCSTAAPSVPHCVEQARRRWVALGLLGVGLSGLAGCITPAKKEPANKTPEWVISPPPDTPAAYYGVGEGVDLAAAKRSALRDIAAKLRVSISGAISNQTTVNNALVNRSSSSSVLEEVQKTEFRNPLLLKSAPSPQGVFALVQVNRAEFVQDTRDKITQLSQKVQLASADLERKPLLEQFLLLQAQVPSLLQIQALYQLLGHADLSAEDLRNKTQMDGLLNKANTLAGSLSFAIKSQPEDADVAAVFSNFITSKGMRVVERAEQASGVVVLGVVQRAEFIRPSSIVKLNIAAGLRDLAQRSVAGREYVVSGVSLLDAASARQQAVKKLQQTLSTASLLEAFDIRN